MIVRDINSVCIDIDKASSIEEFKALRDELKPQIKQRSLIESRFIAEHFKDRYREFIKNELTVINDVKQLFNDIF